MKPNVNNVIILVKIVLEINIHVLNVMIIIILIKWDFNVINNVHKELFLIKS